MWFPVIFADLRSFLVAKARITAGLNALDTEAADTVAGAIAEAEVELVEAVK